MNQSHVVIGHQPCLAMTTTSSHAPATEDLSRRIHMLIDLGVARLQLELLEICGAGGPQRVPLLFRPGDVVLAAAERDLAAPRLGCGQVEQAIFLGDSERLQIRLPAQIKPLASVQSEDVHRRDSRASRTLSE